jgi:hypothetical protein
VKGVVRPLCLGESAFPTKLDDDLREFLAGSGVEYNLLEQAAQLDAEAAWRSIFGAAFRGRPRLRRAAKAEYEYLQQPCAHYMIVPFTWGVPGTSVHVYRQAISAYECLGPLVPLGRFCDAEFFVSPMDFGWTLVHTHENYAFDGPYFLMREWL